MKSQEDTKAIMYGYVNRWQNSSLTQKEFCKAEGINFYRFKYWRTQLKKAKEIATLPATTIKEEFIPIEVPKFQSDLPEVEITYPNNTKISFGKGIQADQVKELIKLF